MKDAKLEPSDRVIFEQDGVNYALIMKKVVKPEAGMFSVKAKNELGALSATARLKITRE